MDTDTDVGDPPVSILPGSDCSYLVSAVCVRNTSIRGWWRTREQVACIPFTQSCATDWLAQFRTLIATFDDDDDDAALSCCSVAEARLLPFKTTRKERHIVHNIGRFGCWWCGIILLHIIVFGIPWE